FHSLAQEQGETAACVFLSGTGSDGSRGLVTVRNHGGMVLVQSPDSAEFDGMPIAALDTGLAEFEGTAEEVASAIHRRTLHAPLPLSHSQPAFQTLVELMHKETGMDLSSYREGTLLRRLQRRMVVLGVSTMDEYVAQLEETPTEAHRFKQEMLIAVTCFFRDAPLWDFLIKTTIPEVLEAVGPAPLRAWVAGCSTGEEAYSMAIAIFEACRLTGRSADFKVFATDLDAKALRRASEGIFPTSSLRGIRQEWIDRYLDKVPEGYSVRRMVRERLIFATHDLLADPPFTRIDIASCRNVLIYLKPRAQRDVMGRFHFGLVSGGVLALGESESVGDSSRHFNTLSKRFRIYQATGESPTQSTILRPRKPVVPTRPRRPNEVENLNATVARKYAPPGVATRAGLDVLHIFGDVTPYVALPEGEVTLNLQRMIAPAASVLLTAAVGRVLDTGKSVTIPGLALGADITCDITVDRFERAHGEEYGLLVFFEPSGVRPGEGYQDLSVDDAIAARMVQLEEELNKTRVHLRSAVEKLETSNEELQATNEELVASNEELQSTNEEMQSVNEELYTVNAEYQQKIAELGELSDDLDHLLHNLEVGTIFLDRRLAVRRFNTLSTCLAPLIDADLGRPVTDLAWRVNPAQILIQVHRALQGQQSGPEVVYGPNGEAWRVVVRTHERRREQDMDGVLLTIVDVTEELARERELREAAELIAAATQLAHVGMIVLNKAEKDVRIAGASRKLLNLKADENLEYEAVRDAIVGEADPENGKLERVLKVGQRRVPVRLFIRPSTDPNQIMVAFQTISATTGAA
ncbi:MAG: CheR family methyltransferase, partial [Myxococcota bacterium]